MSIPEAIFLGAIQGVTEFLPISSSGHLILVENWLTLPVEELKAFDIAIHFGTLIAIIIYFWKDFYNLFKAGFLQLQAWLKKSKLSQQDAEQVNLIRYILIGTIPAILVGLLAGDWLDEVFRSPMSVATTLILVGIFFLVAEKIHQKVKAQKLNQKNTFIIGLAQAMALIPGVSRSGATISSGLVLGISREKAARFSFLLGSVAMTAATLFAVYKVIKGEYFLPETGVLITGIFASMLTGWLTINFLLKFLKNHSLAVFAWYRIVVGIFFLLITFYS